MNAQIARHLNIVESAIVRVEEWANVIFAVIKGVGGRFISKKVVKKMEITVEKLEAIGGKRWQKNGMDRVYFNIEKYVELSNSKSRKLGGAKLYYCNEDNAFYHTATVCKDEVRSAIAEIKRCVEKVQISVAKSTTQSRVGMMMTSLGEWVSVEDWDDIEGAM